MLFCAFGYFLGFETFNGRNRGPEGNIIAHALSRDHKPTLPDEHARISAAGGRVFAIQYSPEETGPARVWLGHVDSPGLAMSRSLGDRVVHSVGVSSEPEFVLIEPDSSRDCVMVAGSDGLWEFISDKEAVEMALVARTPEEAVLTLISIARARWKREEQAIDDVTVIVAEFAAKPSSPDAVGSITGITIPESASSLEPSLRRLRPGPLVAGAAAAAGSA